tara:strand:+ start:345 stop:725 length:381 start_codon:yes stop_codon:yes gene_type:complete
MFNTKIDIKLIFIFILSGVLILSFIFRPSKPIETYEDVINGLKEDNKQLLLSNDSISKINGQLQIEIDQILFVIDSTKVLLKDKEIKIKELEEKRNAVSNIVNSLHADDVTSTISDYLKRRGTNTD